MDGWRLTGGDVGGDKVGFPSSVSSCARASTDGKDDDGEGGDDGTEVDDIGEGEGDGAAGCSELEVCDDGDEDEKDDGGLDKGG